MCGDSTGAPVGVDVRGVAGDQHVFARRPRVPQEHAVHVPGRHLQGGHEEQRAPGRGLAGRLEALLLQHQPR